MTKVSLNDPTPQSEIKQRQGPGGRMLSYVDARFVMDRLDAAVGPENWQDKFEDRIDGSVRCGIGIQTKEGWVWKWDVGDPSDIEATKGVHSDAFKRAGVKWGIGRDLYGDHPSPVSARPSAPQRPAVTPAPQPAQTETSEPYPWDGMGTLPEQAAEIFAGDLVDESQCPAHDKPWRTNSKGYYCATKVGDGWCKKQPSKAWQAQHELAPA